MGRVRPAVPPVASPLLCPPPKHAHPRAPGAQGWTNIVRASWLWGEAVPVLLSLFLRANTAARPASRSRPVVRGGHLHAPTAVTACHRTFEVAPDFPVCLKSLAVYAAAGPASPPPGLSMTVPAARDSGRQPPGLRGVGGGVARGSRDAISIFRVF